LVIHDFFIAPVVFLIAVVVIRRVPQPWKASIQGALIASGILTLTAWPYVAGYGKRPDNRTLLPNDYGPGLLALLALVWATAVAVTLWKHRARKR
jgi:membrane protein implicated in regulation of membrane protease activity